MLFNLSNGDYLIENDGAKGMQSTSPDCTQNPISAYYNPLPKTI